MHEHDSVVREVVAMEALSMAGAPGLTPMTLRSM
jgi:hypothetical protein